MPAAKSKETWFPLFRQFDLVEIAVGTKYSVSTLLQIRGGSVPASDKFRLLATSIFNKTEAELFGNGTEKQGGD